jgi:DNA-binding CsgD family transcriptional regulator
LLFSLAAFFFDVLPLEDTSDGFAGNQMLAAASAGKAGELGHRLDKKVQYSDRCKSGNSMPSGAILALAPSRPNHRTRPIANQGVGVLLMDSSLSPVSCNDETIRILSYPDAPKQIRRLDAFLTETIRARLLNHSKSPRHSPFVPELVSGKRRYLCWVFHLNWHRSGPSHPALELLLERGSSGLLFLPHMAQQFNFSEREKQAVELLLQGLSNKEIADRMNISPNTVNTFFRLIMIKMGVSSRSAILAKMIKASFNGGSN